LAAVIAYNQRKFWGKKDYWFRPLCEELGWEITQQFQEKHRVVLFVVCVDAELVQSRTKHIKQTWSSNKGRKLIAEEWQKVVKTAKNQNKIQYPSTFELFEKLFPNVLK
jgi:hypothetical protein